MHHSSESPPGDEADMPPNDMHHSSESPPGDEADLPPSDSPSQWGETGMPPTDSPLKEVKDMLHQAQDESIPPTPSTVLLAQQAMATYKGKTRVKPTSVEEVDAWLLSRKERRAIDDRRGQALREKVTRLKQRTAQKELKYKAALR